VDFFSGRGAVFPLLREIKKGRIFFKENCEGKKVWLWVKEGGRWWMGVLISSKDSVGRDSVLLAYARAPRGFSPLERHFSGSVDLFSKLEEVMRNDFTSVAEMKERIILSPFKGEGVWREDENLLKESLHHVMRAISTQGDKMRKEKVFFLSVEKDLFLEQAPYVFKAMDMIFEGLPPQIMCFFSSNKVELRGFFRFS